LLTAIVRADGDALVLHAGERPYVVAPSGQSGLASRVLTFEAMTGLLGELLPEEARKTLDELGAVQHVLPSQPYAAGETFTVVAARGGDDIWIEIRRRRAAAAEPPVASAPSEARPANVLPLARSQVRAEHATRFVQAPHAAGIERLLRIAAARGASTLYLTSQARPSIRVDGEISPLDAEGVLSEPDVESLMLDIIPERNRETLRSQAGTA
jgi:hypothetical protein